MRLKLLRLFPLLALPFVTGCHTKDNRLAGAYRFNKNGWIYVHLEGSPEQIGYQHGYLLADEIGEIGRAHV